jgi:hypothetical protein
VSSDLRQGFGPVNAIESIFKVKFEQAFGHAVRNPNLTRLEELPGVILDNGTQALTGKAAEDFTNGNGSEATFWFTQSHQASSGEVFGKLWRSRPSHKKLNSFRELLKDGSAVSWRQGFQDVLHTQARRPRGWIQGEGS